MMSAKLVMFSVVSYPKKNFVPLRSLQNQRNGRWNQDAKMMGVDEDEEMKMKDFCFHYLHRT